MIGTGLRERTSRQTSSPLLPGIMMSRISRSKSISPSSFESASSPSSAIVDLEALLLERVADGLADRRLVVGDQDPLDHRLASIALHRHATGVAAGFAAGSRTQKSLPCPGSESTPISPPITSTIRFAIERPRPKPSCSSEPAPR